MNETAFDAAVDRLIEGSVDWLNSNFSVLLEAISRTVEVFLSCVQNVLLYFPPFLIIGVFGAIAWRAVGKAMAIFTILGLFFCCYKTNLWHETMLTTALVIVATLGALLIAIPFGILSAASNVMNHITRPLMDFMQTMPPYVYLIPAIALLGFGESTAVVTISIFTIPPAVRLTNLGIRQVPVEQVEVGKSFGATSRQILTKVQLHSALPTIMAGVNQCLMLALSLAVIAGIIGGGGLGKVVYKAIMYLDVGKAFDAGLAIVILAIILDRISQGAVELLRKGQQRK